ncbi:lantibiotic dehydratase [Thermotalea metallivorans]|uniref:Nisin biosynthesis protein NisB n=1 Tax=Thermotalea metallivorans TaxID=520762 RepID=A0A140L6X7_9FIRM|nr:lantibiotic dehydratase [Thermotalea metallivorans]KXG76302.1 Nisin biosynthesis protein NisB [Thermotalea metallivorans]
MMEKFLRDPQDMQPPLFQPLDFAMLRTPVLPAEAYQKMFTVSREKDSDTQCADTEAILFEMSGDPFIREAIAVSSQSLLEALNRWETTEDSRKQEQTLSSFLKYMIRMSTRTTPFGLFSGVALARFSDKTDVEIEGFVHHRKRARPDMEWLMAVMKKFERRKEVLEKLKVTANTMMMYVGNRAEIPYITKYGQQSLGKDYHMESISIRATPPVKYVLEMAQEPVPYGEIIDSLIKKYPDTPEEKIRNLVWQLLEKEFIISELRPPLTITKPFEYFIEKLSDLKGTDEEVAKLIEIKELIDQYNDTELGKGEAIYLEIIKKMKELARTKNFVQVDLRLHKKRAYLHKRVATDLAQAAECLWRLASENINLPHLEEYRMDFIEKYGFYREIPVLELLNPDTGLGPPALYEYPKSRKSLKREIIKMNSINQFIFKEILLAVQNKTFEICITPEILEKIEPVKPETKYAPLSLELNAIIAAPSAEEIDKGNYKIYIGPNIGSPGAGKSFGRFIDILGEDIHEKLSQISRLEKEYCHDDAVFAELVYTPSAGRVANVVITENKRDYEIVLSTNSSKGPKETLKLSDLVVGADSERFYLKSKSLNKEVIVTTGHMLNVSGAPNVYRFLREISMDGKRDWTQMAWRNAFELFPFIPRIRYGNVIIFPAQWKLSWEILDLSKGCVFEKFEKTMQEWKKKWNVPRFIYYTIADNRLLFDLEHPLHIKELYNQMKKETNGNVLYITEAECGFHENWVQGSEGKYFAEFVVPFVLADPPLRESKNIHKDIDRKKSMISSMDSQRVMLPGSEWLFLKLYGNSEREEELIAFEMRNFCTDAIAKGYCNQYFFTRYADPEQHIRLRFHGDPKNLYGALMSELHLWLLQLKKDGLLSRACIDTYEREIERYGGPNTIVPAEEVFYYDSIYTGDLLYLYRTNQLDLDIETIAVINIIDLMEKWGFTYSEQLEWFNRRIPRNECKEEYRKERKKLIQWANSYNHWENLCNSRNGIQICQMLNQRGKSIMELAEKVRREQIQKNLYNSEEDIIASIMHMHCNRLIGINRQREKQIMAFARHTLHDLKYFKENLEKHERAI